MTAVSTMNAKELVEAVVQWAEDRGFREGVTIEGQTCKFYEELGEFFAHYNRKQCVKDDLGDMLVVAIVLGYLASPPGELELMFIYYAQQLEEVREGHKNLHTLYLVERICRLLVGGKYPILFYRVCCLARDRGHDPLECLQLAYDEIKDRKGMMIDGKFVKEADLAKVPE